MNFIKILNRVVSPTNQVLYNATVYNDDNTSGTGVFPESRLKALLQSNDSVGVNVFLDVSVNQLILLEEVESKFISEPNTNTQPQPAQPQPQQHSQAPVEQPQQPEQPTQPTNENAFQTESLTWDSGEGSGGNYKKFLDDVLYRKVLTEDAIVNGISDGKFIISKYRDKWRRLVRGLVGGRQMLSAYSKWTDDDYLTVFGKFMDIMEGLLENYNINTPTPTRNENEKYKVWERRYNRFFKDKLKAIKYNVLTKQGYLKREEFYDCFALCYNKTDNEPYKAYNQLIYWDKCREPKDNLAFNLSEKFGIALTDASLDIKSPQTAIISARVENVLMQLNELTKMAKFVAKTYYYSKGYNKHMDAETVEAYQKRWSAMTTYGSVSQYGELLNYLFSTSEYAGVRDLFTLSEETLSKQNPYQTILLMSAYARHILFDIKDNQKDNMSEVFEIEWHKEGSPYRNVGVKLIENPDSDNDPRYIIAIEAHDVVRAMLSFNTLSFPNLGLYWDIYYALYLAYTSRINRLHESGKINISDVEGTIKSLFPEQE